MKKILTENACPPGGHYSQATVHNGVVYVAGQLPITKDGDKITGSAAEQTRAVLANVAAILEAANSGLDHVLQATVYVSDVALWGEVNEVYAEVFGDHKPARAVVPTRELHFGFLVEIAVTAAVRDSAETNP